MTINPSKRQRHEGFAVIAALFLVVVLAALGAFMVGISNTEHLDSQRDFQGSRAYWTAKAGLEWGLGAAKAVPLPQNMAVGTCTGNLVIAGFTASVTCTVTTYLDPTPRYIVRVSSTAFIGGAPGALGYVERTVSGTLER